MRIYKIYNNSQYSPNNISINTKRESNFKGNTNQIQKELLNNYGINADFKGNNIVAECVKSTTSIFNLFLGKQFLPHSVKFTSFSNEFKNTKHENNCLGLFNPNNLSIYINSDLSCYDSLKSIEKENRKGHYYFFNDEKSTYSPFHTFVHEFAHCAHYKNLTIRNRAQNWNVLANRNLDNRDFDCDGSTLGKYAKTDLCEYLAESITKDILSVVQKIPNKCDFYLNGLKEIKSIKTNNLIIGNIINTYYIWIGDIEKINKNLQERINWSYK